LPGSGFFGTKKPEKGPFREKDSWRGSGIPITSWNHEKKRQVTKILGSVNPEKGSANAGIATRSIQSEPWTKTNGAPNFILPAKKSKRDKTTTLGRSTPEGRSLTKFFAAEREPKLVFCFVLLGVVN